LQGLDDPAPSGGQGNGGSMAFANSVAASKANQMNALMDQVGADAYAAAGSHSQTVVVQSGQTLSGVTGISDPQTLDKIAQYNGLPSRHEVPAGFSLEIPDQSTLAGITVTGATAQRGADGAQYYAQRQALAAQNSTSIWDSGFANVSPSLAALGTGQSWIGSAGFSSFDQAQAASDAQQQAWMRQSMDPRLLIDPSQLPVARQPAWADSSTRTFGDDLIGLGKSAINLIPNAAEGFFRAFGPTDFSFAKMSVTADEARGYGVGNYTIAAASVAMPVLGEVAEAGLNGTLRGIGGPYVPEGGYGGVFNISQSDFGYSIKSIPADLVADTKGVYGYLPVAGSQFAPPNWTVDWTNPMQVASARQVRLDYHQGLANEAAWVSDMRATGVSDEDIASQIVDMRNQSRMSKYSEDQLPMLYARNVNTYGNQFGPTYESLLAKYGSPQGVIASGTRSNPSMDILTGIAEVRP